MRNVKNLYPIILAIAAQAMAAVILVGIIQILWRYFAFDLPVAAKLVIQAAMAMGFTCLFRLPRWWLWIQLLLPFILFASLRLDLPAWAYLLAFVLLMLVYWNSADDRVPLYLTNAHTADWLTGNVIQTSAMSNSGTFVDLGCGPGGLLIRLAKQNPAWRFIGVESAPLLWMIAYLRVRFARLDNVTLCRQSLWNMDLSGMDIIYAFLSPAPMNALYEKFQAEASPGSILVSNSFTVPHHEAQDYATLDDHRKTVLYLWSKPDR